MPPIPGGTLSFTVNNQQATCAGYSQTWLALSLMHNGPVTTPGIIQNQHIIGQVHQTAHQASTTSLAANGMSIVGAPVVLNHILWKDAFKRLAQCKSGFYYITTKNPHHAMACYIDPHNQIYYLEPEEGLHQFDDLGAFILGTDTWYTTRTNQAANQEFKIYQVTPSGTPAAPATGARPLAGGHRV